VAPFVAQKRALKREANTNRIANARFETIHTSQGSESTCVILDLVLTGGLRGGRSRMLDDNANLHLPNLLNVAASRAQKCLVVIAHCDFLEREYGIGLVGRFLRQIGAKGSIVEVPQDLRCTAVLDAAISSELLAE
jgi:hypothetical protein